jgi:hypothetical protein
MLAPPGSKLDQRTSTMSCSEQILGKIGVNIGNVKEEEEF